MSIVYAGVSKRWGDVAALDGFDLEIPHGELIVLVGPSGSGKSTALRILAGLDAPSSGSVLVDGRDVTRVPPQARNLAMVFQDHALYPHLDVRENLAFGLRVRRLPPARIEDAVQRVAEQLGLGDLLERRPEQLSGGQQQRVALARAMVREPRAYLMDEPLSSLDAQLRLSTREEIVQLHRRLGATTVYVTHDQAEAMTMGDRIAVLARGRLQQVGPPQAVYDLPANLFVAGFLGSPPMNLLPGGGVLGGGRDEIVGVRPEDLLLDDGGPLHATVAVVEPLGSETILSLRTDDGLALSVRRPPRETHHVGERVRLRVAPERVHRFDATTGLRR